MPAAKPINLFKKLWPHLSPLVDKHCESRMDWPILFGFAAQEVLQLGTEAIAPGIAAGVLMKCAVPMSKIGPEWLSK